MLGIDLDGACPKPSVKGPSGGRWRWAVSRGMGGRRKRERFSSVVVNKGRHGRHMKSSTTFVPRNLKGKV